MVDIWRLVWGKTEPTRPLWCHLLDTGFVAHALLSPDSALASIVSKFAGATGCPLNQTRSWLSFLVGLHDIGKCASDFQCIGPTNLTDPLRASSLPFRDFPQIGFRHEIMTREWVKPFLIETAGWHPKAASVVSSALGGHHGIFSHKEQLSEPQVFSARWNPLRNKLVMILKESFAVQDWCAPRFPQASVAGVLLVALTVFSDWIASNDKLFPTLPAIEDPAKYVDFISKYAIDVVTNLGLIGKIGWEYLPRYSDVWTDPKLNPPRPVQKECEQISLAQPNFQLLIIEAPMGEGKTESALHAATRAISNLALGGLYMALPTAATSNQMWTRIREFIEPHDPDASEKVRLVHSMAWLVDKVDQQNAAQKGSEIVNVKSEDSENQGGSSEIDEQTLALEWFRPMRRGLLAPYGVGTVDQALMAAMHVKFGFLRLLGLAGKVLIIDEVHAYDAYMSQILARLLEWTRVLDIPVILLSATLPQSRKNALLEKVGAIPPSCESSDENISNTQDKIIAQITLVDRQGKTSLFPITMPSRAIQIKLVVHPSFLGDEVKTAKLACDLVEGGGCLCVIANTVDRAQAIFREIKKRYPGEDDECITRLFHARFPAARRSEIEKEVLAFFDKRSIADGNKPPETTRPKRAILVATQVVEQSLDLDFDVMISDLAPVDLLLQRVGRLHRHIRPSRPTGSIPTFHILLPTDGDLHILSLPYDEYRMLRTWITIRTRLNVALPEEIRPLVEEVYSEEKSTPLLPNFAQEDLSRHLQIAKRNFEKKQEEDEIKAQKYLLPPPDARSFALTASTYKAFVEDEDGGGTNFFYAKTRTGDDNQRVLLLEGPVFQNFFTQQNSPPRIILQGIFGYMVNLRGSWVWDTIPETGFDPIIPAPRWARGMLVLRMQNNSWQGRDRNNRQLIIRYDSTYGVLKEKRNQLKETAK